MAKVKLDLRSKSDPDLQQFGETHAAKMEGNEYFANPDPNTAEYAASLDVYSGALDKVDQAFATYLNLVAHKNQAREAFMTVLTKRGNYVENASNGDPARILSAGFEVRDENRNPIDVVTPTRLDATLGDHTGEVDLTWDAVKGARTYIIECRLHDATSTWQQAKFTTRSTATIANLESGKVYLFRVKAIGAKGESDWSNETSKMAP